MFEIRTDLAGLIYRMNRLNRLNGLNVEHRTSNIEHRIRIKKTERRTSNVQRRTSNNDVAALLDLISTNGGVLLATKTTKLHEK